MWIDSHCHPFSAVYDKDRELILNSARAAGVSGMLVVGFDPKSNRQSLSLAKENADMWCTMGVHPCDTGKWTLDEENYIKEIASKENILVGIGETGLDYHHMKASKEEQEKVFRAQIILAKNLNLPLIVHSRDAAEDTLRILIENEAENVIFHCYSYDLEFAKKLWKLGYITSFSGVVTYPKAVEIQEAARQAPADLILIETDAPYLAPQSMRGKRNEMACVVEVGQFIADLRGEAPEMFAAKLRRNFECLFELNASSPSFSLN